MRHYGMLGTVCIAIAGVNAVGLVRLGTLPVLLWAGVVLLAILDFRKLNKFEQPIQALFVVAILIGFNAERLGLGPLGATWVFLITGVIFILFQARNRERLASGRMPRKQRLFWWVAVMTGIAMAVLLSAAFGELFGGFEQ